MVRQRGEGKYIKNDFLISFKSFIFRNLVLQILLLQGAHWLVHASLVLFQICMKFDNILVPYCQMNTLLESKRASKFKLLYENNKKLKTIFYIFCNKIFCHSIPYVQYIKDVWVIHQAWKSAICYRQISMPEYNTRQYQGRI